MRKCKYANTNASCESAALNASVQGWHIIYEIIGRHFTLSWKESQKSMYASDEGINLDKYCQMEKVKGNSQIVTGYFLIYETHYYPLTHATNT